MIEKRSGPNSDYEVIPPPWFVKYKDPIGLAGFSKSFEEELPKGSKNKLPKTLGTWQPPTKLNNPFPIHRKKNIEEDLTS